MIAIYLPLVSNLPKDYEGKVREKEALKARKKNDLEKQNGGGNWYELLDVRG